MAIANAISESWGNDPPYWYLFSVVIVLIGYLYYAKTHRGYSMRDIRPIVYTGVFVLMICAKWLYHVFDPLFEDTDGTKLKR